MKKIEALANYLNVSVEALKESSYDSNVITHVESGDEYLVCTYDEAREYARQDIENIFEDLGIEAFTPSFQEWIIDNAIQEDAFYEWQEESNRSYCEDIANERGNGFDNRLIEECYDDVLIDENDFELDEEGEVDYYNCKLDNDELIERYTQHLCKKQSSVDYIKELYSGRELANLLIENNAIDMDIVVEECISADGVAHFIATYDGNEIELEDNYYAYRV